MSGQNIPILKPGEVHLWSGACVQRQKRDEVLRRIAVNYSKNSFEEMCLSYLPGGKPSFEKQGFYFSLSHTANKLFAVFASFDVGVDVEMSDREVSTNAIAQRYFDPTECALLAACNEAERRTIFFRMWVRKEATVKMTGEGLGLGLQKVIVDPRKEGWSIYRQGEALFVKEVIPWPGALGAIVARCQFSVTACREF